MRLTLNSRTIIGVTAIALIVSCGSRGELAFAPEAASVGSVETVLVSTNRAPIDGLPFYTRERADQPQFARFQVSVPPDRELGTVTYPRRSPPDPRTDFLVVAAQRLPDERALLQVSTRCSAEPPDRGSATFHPRVQHQLRRGALPACATSARPGTARRLDPFRLALGGRPRGYLYDRESALFSRNALATTIDSLAPRTPRSSTSPVIRWAPSF